MAAPVDGETGVLPGDWLPAPPQSSPSQADGAGEVLPEPPQSAPLQADGDGAGAGCSVLPVGACTCPSEIYRNIVRHCGVQMSARGKHT